MFELYEGVEFCVAIPENLVNMKIKQVVKAVKQQLNCDVRVNLREANESFHDLKIEKGDYFIVFCTNGFKCEWSEEDIRKTGYEIKEITGDLVYVKTYGPYECVMDGKHFS